MKLFKKMYFSKVIRQKTQQVWDAEFKKRYLGEIREGIRIEYDRVKELLDGINRRLCMEKYLVMYTGDAQGAITEVDVKSLPLSPVEIEALPTMATVGQRYYKVEKKDVDQKIIEGLNTQAVQLAKQVEGMEANLKNINQRIEGPLFDEQGNDQSLNGTIDGLMTLISILKQHKKSL